MQVLKSTEFRTCLLKGWFQAYLGRQPTERRPGLRGRRAAHLLTGPLPDCKARTTTGFTAAPPRPGKRVVRHLWGT